MTNTSRGNRRTQQNANSGGPHVSLGRSSVARESVNRSFRVVWLGLVVVSDGFSYTGVMKLDIERFLRRCGVVRTYKVLPCAVYSLFILVALP